MKIKRGFSLAEILLTLTVIRIVAAITIPGLTSNIQDKQFKAAFKTTYATLSQAVVMAAVDNGGSIAYLNGATEAGDYTDNNKGADGLLRYLNYSKKCLLTSGIRLQIKAAGILQTKVMDQQDIPIPGCVI